MARFATWIACALLWASSASAADVTVQGSVLPGRLSVGSPRAWTVSVSRRARAAALLAVPFEVRDLRGSGAGWTIAAAVSSPLRVVLRGVSVQCGGCTVPRNAVEYPIALRGGRPATVFRARRRSGMGRMRLTAHLGVQAGGRRAGLYSVALRIAHTAGP